MIIDGIVVVEGKEDKAVIASFVSSNILTLNGLEVSPDVIEYLKNQNLKVIVLVDPDPAGLEIRQKINSLIPNCVNLEIDDTHFKKNKKHGVAECYVSYLQDLLKPYAIKEQKTGHLSLADIYCDDFITRKANICNKYHLGHCSTKEMIKRLNYLGITIEEIKAL